LFGFSLKSRQARTFPFQESPNHGGWLAYGPASVSFSVQAGILRRRTFRNGDAVGGGAMAVAGSWWLGAQPSGEEPAPSGPQSPKPRVHSGKAGMATEADSAIHAGCESSIGPSRRIRQKPGRWGKRVGERRHVGVLDGRVSEYSPVRLGNAG